LFWFWDGGVQSFTHTLSSATRLLAWELSSAAWARVAGVTHT
jgi:hypothetical protein